MTIREASNGHEYCRGGEWGDVPLLLPLKDFLESMIVKSVGAHARARRGDKPLI